MIIAARSIRMTHEGISGKDCSTGRKAGLGAGRPVLTVPGGQRMPRKREPRKRPSEAPRQPRIHIGMWVLIKVPCEFSGCRRGLSWYQGQDSRYFGVIEQKRGDSYLVATRLYGGFWVKREQMYTRDHNGITWTTPLFVAQNEKATDRV